MVDMEFHAKVLRVEQRTKRVYKQGFAEAKIESKAKEHVEDEPLGGWWLVLEDWPVALRFGSGELKPDIEPGDMLVLTASVLKGKRDG